MSEIFESLPDSDPEIGAILQPPVPENSAADIVACPVETALEPFLESLEDVPPEARSALISHFKTLPDIWAILQPPVPENTAADIVARPVQPNPESFPRTLEDVPPEVRMNYQNALRLSVAELPQCEKLTFAMCLISMVTPDFYTEVITPPFVTRGEIFSQNMCLALEVADEYPPDAKILLPIAIELLLEEI